MWCEMQVRGCWEKENWTENCVIESVGTELAWFPLWLLYKNPLAPNSDPFASDPETCSPIKDTDLFSAEQLPESSVSHPDRPINSTDF